MYYSEFFNDFKNNYSSCAYFYFDRYISIPSYKQLVKLPLVMTTKKGIAFFVEIPRETQNPTSYIKSVFNCFSKHLSVKTGCYIACGIPEEEQVGKIYSLDLYNDRLIPFDFNNQQAFFEVFDADLKFKPDCFVGSEEKECFDKILLLFKTGNNDKVLKTASGNMLINRHGTWREASEIEEDKLFIYAALGGVFGVHYFYERRWAKGILYLLTLGLFGFGWLLDIIYLFSGSYKDKTGRYVLAPSLDLFHMIFVVVGVVVTVGIILLSIFIYSKLTDTTASLISSLISAI